MDEDDDGVMMMMIVRRIGAHPYNDVVISYFLTNAIEIPITTLINVIREKMKLIVFDFLLYYIAIVIKLGNNPNLCNQREKCNCRPSG